MRIKSIKLQNFRNFESNEFRLGKATTVFIGKNGTGKTNLISAMVKSLSFIFSKQKYKKQYSFISSSDQGIKGFTATDPRFGKNEADVLDYIYSVNLSAEGELDAGYSIQWQFEQETIKSGLKESLYRDAYNAFWNYYNSKGEKPVLAFFSDSFPHVKFVSKTYLGGYMKYLLESGNPLPPNAGYYKWDEELNCADIWVTYFSMQWLNNRLNPNKAKEAYVRDVIDRMIEFSCPISEYSRNEDMKIKDISVEFRGNENMLLFEFMNGKQLPFANLPQGYKRIFSIVFDLANRSYLLNNHCNPDGIVLIDEIELHLHPSIAKEVLQRLRRSFPKIQFIVTTHSPLVITTFKQDEADNCLFKLFYNEEEGCYGSERISDLFGMDYNTGLTDVMETAHSDESLEKLKQAYLYWLKKDEKKAAKIAELIRKEYAIESKFIESLNL